MLESVFAARCTILRLETTPIVTRHKDQPDPEAPAFGTPSPDPDAPSSTDTAALPHNGDAVPPRTARIPASPAEQETSPAAEDATPSAWSDSPAADLPRDDNQAAPAAVEETAAHDAAPPQDDPLPEMPSLALAAPPAPLAIIPPAASLSPLELRIQRLEEAVAALQARQKEDRITTSAPGPSSPPPGDPAPTPAAVPTASPAPTAIQTAEALPARARRPWLLWEIIAEFRIIYRMYVDPRYSMTWMARLVPLVLVVLILLSGWWGPWSYIPFIGWLLDKCIDLVLAFVLFKVLSHEARRYRETSPDLPPSLRL